MKVGEAGSTSEGGPEGTPEQANIYILIYGVLPCWKFGISQRPSKRPFRRYAQNFLSTLELCQKFKKKLLFCLEMCAKYPKIVEISYIYIYKTNYMPVTDADFMKKSHFVKLSPPKRYEILT